MPRHARIVAAGFPLHAILRGIDRSAIFFDDVDYRALLGMLVERAGGKMGTEKWGQTTVLR
jgi:hypothetical protein